jgi:ABC-2 type transport system permease protein
VALIPAALAAGWSLAQTSETPTQVYATLMETILVPSVAALVSLVLGASAIGDERDDGTIVYLAATPLPRRSIVTAKLAAGWVSACVLLLPGAALCLAFSLGTEASVRAWVWSLVAVAATAAAYTSVFGLLSLALRRPVVVGFLYILFWEGSIASVAPSATRLSIASYGRKLVAEGIPGADTFNVPDVSSTLALTVLVVVSAGALALASWRLARTELP